jgi:TP901 family phage tail tape measure protein
MAESYRGLTIRIGGDTTKLTKALKTANGAISGTQQELRKLEQALRLDPANVEALGLKMGFVENQAQNTAMRLAQLRDAMDETGSRKILDDNGLQTTVAELAKVSDEFGNIGGEVENASMKLAQARATMNQATESLASMHDEVTSLAQSAAKVESARVAAALDLSEGVPSAEKVKELFASLPSYVAQDEKAVDALIEAIGKAGDSTDGLDKLVEKASQLKGVTFNFANDNTDVKTMTDALEDMSDLLGGEAFDRTRIQGFGEEIERLQAALATAQDETERWTLVTEFQDLVAEIAKGESSMERFNRVLSDMGLPSEVSQGLAEVMANAKALGESQGSLASLGAALESAFNARPENLELLEAAITAYASAGQVAVERTETLSQRLDALGAKDIEIDPLKSATQQLFEASEAADKAGGEYNDLQGKIAHVETVLAKLNATADENKRILSDDERAAIFNEEHVRSVEQLNQRLADYRSRLAAAEEAARKASSALESARIRKEIEDVSGELAKTKVESDKAYESLAKLTGAQGVEDAAGESLREVRELGTAFESAATRAQALQKWSKLDPTNMAAATDATDALGDAAEIAKARIKAIDSAIKSLSSDDVTEVTSAFGTAEEAVKRTSDAFARVKRASDEARKALSDAMKNSGLAGLEEAVLAADDSIESELSPEIAKLRDNVLALDSALEDVESGMQAAFNGQAIENLMNARADTMKGVADAVGASSSDYQAAFQHSIDRVADLAARAGREIVDSANTIDSAFRDMKKTVNGTEDDFRALREEAVKFSQTNAVSSDTLLEMESLGGQFGVTVDKLQSFGEVASHLDIATDIGASDIALQMGQLSNIMSDFSYDNFENFADSLVRLGNNTATTESAIMNVAQRMAAVANVTSMTTPELLSWSAAIASTGMRSESAATAITKTITGIGQAVAGGGKTLQAFADIAGMSAEKFEQSWRTSSSEALESFVKGLERLTDDSTDAIDALESVGIKSVRQSTAMLALSQTIDNLDKSLEMSVDAWNGIGDEWGQAGDAAREAHNKSDGFGPVKSIHP